MGPLSVSVVDSANGGTKGMRVGVLPTSILLDLVLL